MTSDELQRLLEPTVERLGYEIIDLEVRLGGKSGVVRVFIDRPDGMTGPGPFQFASELVAYIRSEFGDHFPCPGLQ